ncbi:MAG: YbaY family lipoprotein [Rhodospirillales bacterium]|nr:YbaY family lipoprotein [Rhodospirillales bacterium]
MRFLLAILAFHLALPAAAQDLPVVRGTAAYRERIALPPDAVLEAELQDVSRADAPALVLGSFRAGPAGQVPIPFAIPYDPARIVAAGRYVVRARILEGGRPLFATDTAAPVLTQGAGDRVALMLTRVGAAPLTRRLALAGPRWVLVKIVDLDVTPSPDGRAPYLQFDAATGRFSGDGGCNRFAGSFVQKDASLTIGPTARTMMACIGPAMETENRFVGALQQVKTWVIEGRTLTLGDGAAALLRFEPR